MFFNLKNESEHDFLKLVIKICLKKKKSGNGIGLYRIFWNPEISGDFSSLTTFIS